MQEVTLFDITLPSVEFPDGEADELYCRITDGEFVNKFREDAYVSLRKGGSVSFDTFYNLFSYRHYIKFTDVESVNVDVFVEGHALVSLRRHRAWKGIPGGGYTTDTLVSEEIDSSIPVKVTMSSDMDEPVRGRDFDTFDAGGRIDLGEFPKLYGFYYVDVIALSDDVKVHGGRWWSEVEKVNDVHLCVGICTFKREEQVKENIDRVCHLVETDPDVKGSLDLFVADNGGTLAGTLEETDYFKVFANKNTGGSGGFTRTLMEAWYRRDEFTHMLFMDDDIAFDPKVLKKTINLLRVMGDGYRHMFIGGSTIHLTSPYYQYEQGSRFNMTARGVKKFDLKPVTSLLHNEVLTKVDFCGWTYTCFPLEAVQRNGLPLPLFIKGDDGEFSLRNGSSVLMMNGIGIWHEPYSLKHSTHLTYFDTRNKMIMRALYGDQLDLAWEVSDVKQRANMFIDKQFYDEAEFFIMAVEDFLKGPDFLLNNDEEKQLAELLPKRTHFLQTEKELRRQGYNVSALQLKNPRDFADRGIQRKIDDLTGNGVRVPGILQRRGVYTVDFDSYKPEQYARKKKLLHWSQKRNMGMVTERDPKKYDELHKRYKEVLKNLKENYMDVALEWRRRVNELTCFTFWEKHLGLPVTGQDDEQVCYRPAVPANLALRRHKDPRLNRLESIIAFDFRRRDLVDIAYGDVETTLHKVLRRAHLGILSPTMRDLGKFKDIHDGERCFIVCPGPSLTLDDIALLKDEWTFGVNSIFNVSAISGWKPNYYVMCDASGYRRQEAVWDFDSFATDAVFINNRIIQWQKEFTRNAHGFVVNHRTSEHYTPADRPMRYEKDASVCVYDRGTVTNAAIDIALYMGFKEIYLIGVDHNYKQADGRRHFMDTEDDGKRKPPTEYHMLVSTEGYQVSALHSRVRKAKIYNCTRGGKLRVFPRRKLEDVLGIEEKPQPVLPEPEDDGDEPS